MRDSFIIIIVLIVFSTIPSYTSFGQPVLPRIGMSGSFYTLSNITISIGGEINSSDVFVVVYCYGNNPVHVHMSYESPNGITINFIPNETNFTLNPGESKRFQVSIKVSPDIVPGSYPVSITASEVVESNGEVSISPAVTQQINVIVSGQYADLHVYALDPQDSIIKTALIRVYRTFKGRMISIADSYGGELHARLTPGKYDIKIFIAGDLVSEQTIVLNPYDNRTIRTHVRIIFIEYFSIQPILGEKDTFIGVRLKVILKNVYKTIEDAQIVLNVKRNGQSFDNRTLLQASILPQGRVEYTFDYIPSPPLKWERGNYTFQIFVYGMGGKLLAESEPKWLNYNPPLTISEILTRWILPFAIPLALLVFIWLVLHRRKRRKKSKKEERIATR